MAVHLIKLCVGADCVEDLLEWQAGRMAQAKAEGRPALPVHLTRMWPKRESELVGGGSIYWVFKGLVLARQRIVGLEPRTGGDGVVRCALALDPELVRVRPVPRRPFQGWRYLRPEDAPADLVGGGEAAGALPPEMEAELAAMGVF